MKAPEIDESKMAEVMELIEKAASLMEENIGSDDAAVKQELDDLQKKLRDITGNKKLNVSEFQRYWSYTSLETMAKKSLRLPPEKCDVADDQLREIVVNILNHDEADMDYWLKFLEVNTGLEDLTDYIFYPDFKGMDGDATLEQIADKIIADKNNLQ